MKKSSEDAKTYWVVMARDSLSDGKPHCLMCGALADDVHEIIPRSYYNKRDEYILFAIENRCCLCRSCHEKSHNNTARKRLLEIMIKKYGYDYNNNERAKWLLSEYQADE